MYPMSIMLNSGTVHGEELRASRQTNICERLTMRRSLHAEGFGVRLRPVQITDAPFIVWLRNQDYVKGRVGDSAPDAASQEKWLETYFEREGDYYFVV